MENTTNDEQKFIPCYNKNGTWYHLDDNVDIDRCNWWYEENEFMKEYQKTIQVIMYGNQYQMTYKQLFYLIIVITVQEYSKCYTPNTN